MVVVDGSSLYRRTRSPSRSASVLAAYTRRSVCIHHMNRGWTLVIAIAAVITV